MRARTHPNTSELENKDDPQQSIKAHSETALATIQKRLKYVPSCFSAKKTLTRLKATTADPKIKDEEIKTAFNREANALSTYTPGGSIFKKYAAQFIARAENESKGLLNLSSDLALHAMEFLNYADLLSTKRTSYHFFKHATHIIDKQFDLPKDYFNLANAALTVKDVVVADQKDVKSVQLTSNISLSFSIDNKPKRLIIHFQKSNTVKEIIISHATQNIIPLQHGYFLTTGSLSETYATVADEKMTLQIYHVGKDKQITYALPYESELYRIKNIRVEENGDLTLFSDEDKALTLGLPFEAPSRLRF